MTRFAILFALVLAMLVTAVHSPSVAHEPSSGHSHTQVSTGDHDHFSGQDDVGDMQSDDLMQHHHCPNAWCAEPFIDAAPASFQRTLILPGNQQALASLTQAPPTQPPSA